MTHEEALYRVKGYLTDIIPAEDYSEVEEIIKALEQQPSRDIKEIAEIMKCDVDAETKCKMISNILIAKPHYFELDHDEFEPIKPEEMQKCKDIVKKYTPKQQPCDDATIRKKEKTEQDPCETCGYAEGSPFCLQYCPYDAERKEEQEPCEDISPTAVPVTVEEAKKLLQAEWKKEVSKDKSNNRLLVAYKMAIQLLEQESCDDPVSREAVCNIVNDIRDCISVEGYWAFLERLKKLPSVTQKPIECDLVIYYRTKNQERCKDCKWWRDSDGAYRRGVKAESKCPINTVSVANGWGYCYMFKPQESEDKK